MSATDTSRAVALQPDWTRTTAFLRERRFWVIQGVVGLVVVTHDPAEAVGLVPDSGLFHDVTHIFLRDFFFIIPVTYAALRYGLRGALATVAWCTVITIPIWFFLNSGVERIGPISQFVVVYVIALTVGSRVDREAASRDLARSATRLLESSEARYRGVFEAASDGMLVLDERGVIIAANGTASALCGAAFGGPVGRAAAAVLPQPLLQRLDGTSAGGDAGEAVAVRRPDGVTRWVQPEARSLGDRERSRIVLLRDVTEQHRREVTLEHFASEMLRTQEEERQRIAQDLHDDTVQALVLLCRRLDALADERGDRASPRERAQLLSLRSYTESSLASLRDYLHGLRPSVLDDLGLVAAIRRLAANPGLRPGLAVAFVPDEGDRRLSPEAELALYRIAQEALRNADRHSGAEHVVVTLRFEAAGAELTVADDGCGFDPSATDHQGLGLRGMEERARNMGGRLTVHSAPGRGTTVIARVTHFGRPRIDWSIEEAGDGGGAAGRNATGE